MKAFLIIAGISIVGQYVLVAVIRTRIKKTSTSLPLFRLPHILVAITQYFLIALLLIIILNVILFSTYYTAILQAIIMVSYGLSIIAFSFLAAYLIKWYSYRKSYLVLLYGISASLFVTSFILLLIFFGYVSSNFPAQIQLHHHNLPYFNNPGSPTFFAYNGYIYLSIVSFIITWLSTVAVLHTHSKKMGRTKYWLVVSLPLVYFLSQFLTLFPNVITTWLEPDPVLYGITLLIIFTISRSLGGIFFGLAFWMMARSLKIPSVLRDYLRITAIGFMLLFVSDQALGLIFVPYPPFGLSSVIFVGLASYFILIGLYYSAISISNDMKLRKYIYSSAQKELSMLGSIGTARSEEQISRVVSQVVSDNQETIEKEFITPSFEDIKMYTAEVIQELRKEGIR